MVCPTGERQARTLAWLQRADFRPTRQRLVLADLLVGDGRDRHVTAEGLFEAAQAAGTPVALATVYNTLRSFTAAGLISEIVVDGSRSYFDTNTSDHAHYYWEDDATLTDAPSDAVRLEGLPKVPPGTEVAKIDVVIRLRRIDGAAGD